MKFEYASLSEVAEFGGGVCERMLARVAMKFELVKMVTSLSEVAKFGGGVCERMLESKLEWQ